MGGAVRVFWNSLRWQKGEHGTTRAATRGQGIGWALLLLCLLSLSGAPLHASTPAGTVITNTAVATYDGGTVSSNSVAFVVGFADVALDHWAFDEIMACLKAGIVGGYPDGNYHPELSVSRGQMAVFVSRAVAGGEENVPDGPAEASFADVPTDDWAFRCVEYVKDGRIILGYPDRLYHPEYLVGRGQMAVFIARSIVDPTGDGGLADYAPPDTETFADVALDNEWSWCYGHVEYIASLGLVSGYPDELYHPELTCSRDQMAVFIARAFELPL